MYKITKYDTLLLSLCQYSCNFLYILTKIGHTCIFDLRKVSYVFDVVYYNVGRAVLLFPPFHLQTEYFLENVYEKQHEIPSCGHEKVYDSLNN